MREILSFLFQSAHVYKIYAAYQMKFVILDE